MMFYNNKKGFSLLEMIVVIFIISLGLVGILSLAVSSLKAGKFTKGKLVASELAQEGLEMVKNIRDENWLEEDDWLDGINTGDGTFIIDYTGESSIDDVPDSAASPGAKLYRDSNGWYQHSSSTVDTVFYRIIKVNNSNTASSSISCTVRWTDPVGTHDYTADMVLYDWKIE